MTTTALPKTVTNSIGMRFVLVPAGTFVMGSPLEEKWRSKDEVQHEVVITRPFYLGVFEVTQKQWQAVMGSNPSSFNPEQVGSNIDDFPVESVSWLDAQVFLEHLTAREEEKQAGRTYRLPTEAEWEYACRAGASEYRVFHYGNTLCSTQANFNGNYPFEAAPGPYLERPTPVGMYEPNAFGLYDMHGNVWEWCADWYDKDYYPQSPRCDPTGPVAGTDRVLRGGSWDCFGPRCRSAWRNGIEPVSRCEYLGFRVALVTPE
jgi:formylglycine-generating enzyme required for sulfatase activity